MAQEGSKEELEQLEYMHEVYLKEYEDIVNTLSAYNSIASQVSMSREVVSNMDKLKGKGVLFSVGSGMYISASVDSGSNFIVYIGAGYFTEKSAAEAQSFIEAYSKRNEEIIKQLNSEKRKLEEEIFDIEYMLNSMQQ